jgi:hypothetical protein
MSFVIGCVCVKDDVAHDVHPSLLVIAEGV